MRRYARTCLCVVAALINLPAILSAEEAGDSVPNDSHPTIRILQNPHYHDLLQLSDQQKESIKQLAGDWIREEQRLNELRSQLDRREFRRRSSAARPEFTKKAEELLTAEQREIVYELIKLQWFIPQQRVTGSNVQKELKLSEKQREAITEIRRNFVREVFAQVHGLQRTGPRSGSFAGSPFQIKASEIAQAATVAQRDRINRLLTQNQRIRLSEIELQYDILFRGGAVFLEADVITSLALSKQQQQAIRQLNDDFERRTATLRPGIIRGDFQKEQILCREFFTKFLELLTQEQRQRWDSMVGKPFSTAVSNFISEGTTQSDRSENEK